MRNGAGHPKVGCGFERTEIPFLRIRRSLALDWNAAVENVKVLLYRPQVLLVCLPRSLPKARSQFLRKSANCLVLLPALWLILNSRQRGRLYCGRRNRAAVARKAVLASCADAARSKCPRKRSWRSPAVRHKL